MGKYNLKDELDAQGKLKKDAEKVKGIVTAAQVFAWKEEDKKTLENMFKGIDELLDGMTKRSKSAFLKWNAFLDVLASVISFFPFKGSEWSQNALRLKVDISQLDLIDDTESQPTEVEIK